MSDLVWILISAMVVNNFTLALFLGLCPFMGVSARVATALRMGGANIFVLVLTSLSAWVLNTFVLIHAPYLRLIAFIVVIASLVQIVEMIIKKVSPTLFRELGIYLNDHLAGSVAALDLLDRLTASADPSLGTFFAALRADIEADRAVLRELMTALEVSESLPRKAASWMGERLTELKLLADDPSRGPLHLLEALEALGTGIHGKLCLWHALLAGASSGGPALRGLDYERLAARAIEQRERLEPVRLAAASSSIGTYVGYTGLGAAATSAVGLLAISPIVGTPSALVKGTGYGALQVSAANAPRSVLVAAGAPVSSAKDAAREVRVHVIRMQGTGEATTLRGLYP